MVVSSREGSNRHDANAVERARCAPRNGPGPHAGRGTTSCRAVETKTSERSAGRASGGANGVLESVRERQREGVEAVSAALDVVEERLQRTAKRLDVVGEHDAAGTELRLEQPEHREVELLPSVEKHEIDRPRHVAQ